MPVSTTAINRVDAFTRSISFYPKHKEPETMPDLVRETDFSDLTLLQRGKVRDIYDLGDRLLLVATDRLSAFDVVLPDPIPDKGRVLTQISLFWFEQMASIIANHLITADVTRYPEACRPYAEVLEGRSMLVRKARPLPIECVVRGYLSGSAWAEYKKNGTVNGKPMPSGLRESEQLAEPLFKRRLFFEGLFDERRNLSQFGLHARCNDNGLTRTSGERRPLEKHIGSFRKRYFFRYDIRRLFNGKGFTGQD